MTNICIINAHPDPAPERFIHALCDAVEDGAREASHGVSRITIGLLDVPMLEKAEDFAAPPPEPILTEREKIKAADHVVIAFPLWLGSMPAKARAFFEQAARAGFFLETGDSSREWPAQLMAGKSAHIFVTMGMPSLVYRFGMDAGALKALERAMLGMSGFKPIHHTIIGGIGEASDEQRQRWLADARALGRKAN